MFLSEKGTEKEAIKLAKRSHDVLSSDLLESVTPVFKKALTCTDKLKTQAAWMESAGEDIGRQNKNLVDRWRCTDERCINEQKDDVSLIGEESIMTWIIVKCITGPKLCNRESLSCLLKGSIIALYILDGKTRFY